MILKGINLLNFRNINNNNYDIHPKLTIIFGQNSQGKTNLLEAIYFLITGTGFREEKEQELISFNKDNCQVSGLFSQNNSNYKHSIFLKLSSDRIEKKYFLNNTAKGHHLYTLNQITVVLFTPEQVNIIIGSPQLRREYFNQQLSTYDYQYKKRLNNYEVALRKRNKILEKYTDKEKLKEELKFWNSYLIEEGAYITSIRESYINFLNKNKNLDSKIFSINYIKNEFTKESIKEYYEKEILIRRTLVGPQKDDFRIFVNNGQVNKDVHHYGSRSEQRMAIVWLKVNELEYLTTVLAKTPILLLDDIFSELDIKNKKMILGLLNRYQTIATTTEKEVIDLVSIEKEIIEL